MQLEAAKDPGRVDPAESDNLIRNAICQNLFVPTSLH